MRFSAQIRGFTPGEIPPKYRGNGLFLRCVDTIALGEREQSFSALRTIHALWLNAVAAWKLQNVGNDKGLEACVTSAAATLRGKTLDFRHFLSFLSFLTFF
jgi:hypothetical protein